jgi:hypothetical protein
MQINLRLPISVLVIATALVACGRKNSDSASNDDFKRDLQLASSTNLDLAGGKVDPSLLSSLETKPSGAPEAARVVKKGAGNRAIESRTPTVKAAPESDVAAAEDTGPTATESVAPAPEVSEPVAVAPRPAPVNIPASSGGDYGNAGGGVFGGGMGGVVIRGGGVDGDHCQPHGGSGRRGGGVYFPPGGIFVPQPVAPRTGGGISISGRSFPGGSASRPGRGSVGRTASGGGIRPR